MTQNGSRSGHGVGRPSGWVVALLVFEALVCLALAALGGWLALAGLQGSQALPTLGGSVPPVTASTAVASEATQLPSSTISPMPLSSATATLTPSPTPSPSATPTFSPTPDPWAEQILAGMSLEQKIGQMLLMGVDGTQLTSYACGLVRRFAPGGIVYRGGNVISPDQLRGFSAALQDCAQSVASLPLWIALDHEGQYVDRFAQGATVFPAAMAFGATSEPGYAYRAALASGQELAYSGVNLVLGPVADVLLDYDNDVISVRSYGGDPQAVGEYVAQAVQGYRQAGVAAVLKHFPGHGGVPGDTHEVLAVDVSDLARLGEFYLPPFQSGLEAGAPVVMFSHVAFPNIDGTGVTQPASVSPALVNVLRQQLGFQGFILTDSMGMGAIKNTYGNVGQASLLAVSAGVDMLLTTSAQSAQSAYDYLLGAARNGTLPIERIDDAVWHILQAKADYGLRDFPLATAAAPDWAANQELADEIGYRAITVLRDQADSLPLPPAPRRVLVIGPVDGWGLYPALQSALQQAGYNQQLVTFSGPWNGPVPERDYLNSLPSQATRFDLTLVFTWQAHLNRLRYNDNFQAQLVNRLLATGAPVVVVMLKSPTDLLQFPDAPSVLASYGTTHGQIQGLVGVLLGRNQPTGINPLPGLP